MGGEVAGCSESDPERQKGCLERLCGYFSAPVGLNNCSTKATLPHSRGQRCPAEVPRVRGLKQKLFGCVGSSSQASSVSDPSRSRRNATNALETCLQTQWVAESHELYSSVGCRVICSLRRDAFELAMSQYLLRHVVGQGRQPSSIHGARLLVDQERRSDLDDYPAGRCQVRAATHKGCAFQGSSSALASITIPIT